jgi:hypothetical protein
MMGPELESALAGLVQAITWVFCIGAVMILMRSTIMYATSEWSEPCKN